MNIQSFYIDLKGLSSQGLYSMSIIQSLLREYEPLFQKIKRINSALYLYNFDGETHRLPPVSREPNEDEAFLELFEKLTDLDAHYRNEIYCKEQVELLSYFKKENKKLVKYFNDNIEFYENGIFNFFIDYVNDDAKSNNITPITSSNISIHIDPDDFIYTFKFSEAFEKQFFN